MLIVYKLLIDTTMKGLPPDISVGFRDDEKHSIGFYHLSTTPLTGFYDCLDGTYFSDISQENLILKGGELSLAGEVKIKIVSRDIIRHIVNNDIELLGCKVSMLAEIDGKEKGIFEGMRISEYSQADDVSFEITLEDSAFANAGQLNLKVPQGFGSGAQLETSYGSECLLRLYKQDRQETDKTISQGTKSMGYNAGYCVGLELELLPEDKYGGSILINLPTFNKRPSFAKNFSVNEVRCGNLDRPAELWIRLDYSSSWTPEISARLEGRYIEICSGKGKGNVYRITKVEEFARSGYEIYRVVVLDRFINDGDICAVASNQEANFPALPIAANNYKYYSSDSVRYTTHLANIKYTTRQSGIAAENRSVFKFTETLDRYAIPRMKNILIADCPRLFDAGTAKIPNFRVANDDGSLSDVCVKFLPGLKETDEYSLLDFPAGSNNKTVVAEAGKYQPRWGKSGGVAIRASEPNWFIDVTNYARIGQEVEIDSEDSERYPPVVKSYAYKEGSFGVQAELYWRIDDLPFNGKYKIKPRFSFWMRQYYGFSARAILVDDAGNVIDSKNYNLEGEDDPVHYHPYFKISLTRNKVESISEPSNGAREVCENLLTQLQNLLTFNSEVKAKYIYLQLLFEFTPWGGYYGLPYGDLFHFSALPVICEREIDTDKLYIRGYERDSATRAANFLLRTPDDIARRAKRLCLNYDISVNEGSFDEVSKKISVSSGQEQDKLPFIPFKHGDNFQDKLAEICRAANFSMLSDGSKLYAKYFFSGEPGEWRVGPTDVIKGSLGVRSVNSVATEWEFSANTWEGQKTLSIGVSKDFPETEWQPEGGVSFFATLVYPGYMQNEIPGFGARASAKDGENFSLGDMYWVKSMEPGLEPGVACKLVSLRINEDCTDALFIMPHGTLQLPESPNSSDQLEITPLAQERGWRSIVCGNLDIDYASARYLWETSKAAEAKIKKKARLDERYSKHQIAAFATDESWLQNFLKTARHNSFAKSIISFKVPINRLPEGSLSSLLLKRITLAFGRFQSSTLDGWIVGYSFAPAEDAVRIEFMNSEPAKQTLWLDENLLNDQLTVDERESTQDFYSEK
jgi:hypothetical protein